MDGEIRDLDEDINLAKTYRHNIDVVVDRLKIRKNVDFKRRLVDSLETAAEFTDGLITVLFENYFSFNSLIFKSTISFNTRYAFLKIICHSSSKGSIIS